MTENPKITTQEISCPNHSESPNLPLITGDWTMSLCLFLAFLACFAPSRNR